MGVGVGFRQSSWPVSTANSPPPLPFPASSTFLLPLSSFLLLFIPSSFSLIYFPPVHLFLRMSLHSPGLPPTFNTLIPASSVLGF